MLKFLKNIIFQIKAFFPIQLLITDIRKNQILLFFWFILFSAITQSFGKGVGIPYLFLDPEYMGKVCFSSMLIMGFSFGIFTLSYFITSYILDSHRFVFLGTIRFPFVTFCLNNSLIPIIFTITYLWSYFNFQSDIGLESTKDIIIEIFGFLLGTTIVLTGFFLYFRKTNKATLKHLVETLDSTLRKKKINVVRILKNIKQAKKYNYAINSYLNLSYKIRKVKQHIRFDQQELLKIIDQHHLNAVSVELVVFIIIMVIGYFRDIPEFQIPAAASTFLLFSFFTMFTGAFSYWLRGWAISGIIGLAILVNFLFENNVISIDHQAFGMNYKVEKAKYNLKTLETLNTPLLYTQDSLETVQILEKWKTKFPDSTKPKMVLLCVSGGGLRAATWTLTTLSHINKNLNNKLMESTVLITGASGGMVGASYYREMYLRSKTKNFALKDPNYYIDNIAQDVLNPMIFSMIVSDFFIGLDKYKVGDQEYYKGRGYAFEQKINSNTEGVMNKLLLDYSKPEKEALIPMAFLTPTILNDGRKLYISPQNISYMNTAHSSYNFKNMRIKGVELRRFFKKQSADSLHFLTALRMSATFPYVTPNVELPSTPGMEVMDAGYIDNFGITDAVRFTYVFRNWINENTSGVAIINIRDSEKESHIRQNIQQSFWGTMFNPIKSLYANWDAVHDFNNDNSLEYSNLYLNSNFEIFNFQYAPTPEISDQLQNETVHDADLEKEYDEARASLSWHLTRKEKEGIKSTIHNKNNTQTLNRLKDYLEDE